MESIPKTIVGTLIAFLGLTHRRFLGGQSPSRKKRLRPIS